MRTRKLSAVSSFFALLLPVLALASQPLTLHSADHVTIFGSLSQASSHNDKLLLFHQAGGNRHEYDPLIADFNRLGYDTLAIDQRAGGDLFGGHNQTVQALGRSANYLESVPDLDATLAWSRARHRHYDTIVAVGSSPTRRRWSSCWPRGIRRA